MLSFFIEARCALDACMHRIDWILWRFIGYTCSITFHTRFWYKVKRRYHFNLLRIRSSPKLNCIVLNIRQCNRSHLPRVLSSSLHIEIYAELYANYSCGNGNKLRTFNAFLYNSFPLSSVWAIVDISNSMYCKIAMLLSLFSILFFRFFFSCLLFLTFVSALGYNQSHW